MNVVFKNGRNAYIVTEVHYGQYKGTTTTYVSGGYREGNSIKRKMPTKLFKCKRTGRPCLDLSGKMYAINPEDDKLFTDEIMDKAPLK